MQELLHHSSQFSVMHLSQPWPAQPRILAEEDWTDDLLKLVCRQINTQVLTSYQQTYPWLCWSCGRWYLENYLVRPKFLSVSYTAVSLSFYFIIHPPLLESLVQPSPALSSHFPENIFDGQELASSSSVLVAGLDWTGFSLSEIDWNCLVGRGRPERLSL